MTLVAKRSLMPNAMTIPRNVTLVKKAVQIATLLLSALPLAVSLTPNATQAQANALHVIIKPTKTAPKPRLHATKNALLCLYQNATERQENAVHARRAVQVAYQMQHAKIHAPLFHHSTFTCATGTQLILNACRVKRVP